MGHDRHSHSLVKLINEKKLGAGKPTILGAEIGVWKGHTSVILLREIQNLILYCVDPWEKGGDHVTMPSTTREEFAKARAEFLELTEPYIHRRVTMQTTSREAPELLGDGVELDFVFIDGDHTYESVKQDIELWYPKVREGGMISGHDYMWKAGDDFVVQRAVDEFAKQVGSEVSVAPGQVWYFDKR